jgi:hypothetical protein
MNTETQSNNQKKSQRDLEKGALWLKKSKAGADFLSGYITDENNNKVNIVVFKNGFKKPGEMSPDYRVYLSDNQLQSSSPAHKSEKQISQKSENLESASLSGETSDDIPF